ncbi:hypothetical protein R1flu_010049 [Riccia fluitans]|uniref:Uncharacterized protein n=1 Tax=Riccia fluitans TaxID=41844 RepID=A0ABD1Z3W0_9MARC
MTDVVENRAGMAKVGINLLQHEGVGLPALKEAETGLFNRFSPLEKKEQHPHLLVDFVVRTRDVLVARSVVEEIRKRLLHFRGEAKADKEKDKLEKEAEVRVEEKSKAAAWAWYQHGNSGGVTVSPVGLPNPLIVQRPAPSCNARKASRFKEEAQKVCSANGRVDPHWDFEESLFDSYELHSVSKQIDNAFHEKCKPVALAVPPPAASPAKLTRSHSLRVSFPRSLCRSISDVVTHEEMALGVRKGENGTREKTRRDRTAGSGGWSFKKISKAIHFFMNVPAWDSQSQEQERQYRLQHHHEHHHHHHQHEHEHHHHHHYSVRIKDPSPYSKSFHGIERVKAADTSFATFPKAKKLMVPLAIPPSSCSKRETISDLLLADNTRSSSKLTSQNRQI